MAENSSIEWTDHTYNPWIGCTKVSPGCAKCYAEADMDKRRGRVKWGPGNPRSRTKTASQVRRWNRKAEGTSVRPRVFCASLADWLDDEVATLWLADLLVLIHETPHLDWLMLTKRPHLWADVMGQVAAPFRDGDPGAHPGALLATLWLSGSAPANVWMGATVEDQQRAEERIPELLSIPARVRFLSCEPLLEAVTLPAALPGIHWVICGGESGPGARPMHPDWARSLRDQAVAARVPFLFKQWGAWAPALSSLDPGNMARVGKKKAGRLLDGRTWDGVPS